MKRILVPTDFSKTAQMATDVARDIAKKAGAQLILLHVIEEASSSGGSFSVAGQVEVDENMEDRLFMLKMIERAKKQMDKAASDPRLEGVKVKKELRIGSPFHGMTTIIADHKVDLVVMGTAGRSDIENMIIGSNTEKVVRHAACPVLTINKKPSTANFKNIVYATAMNKEEEVFSRFVKRAQEIYNSTIHLVRINTPSNFQRDVEVRKNMEEFARKLMLKNFTINIFNDLNEEEGIIYFADSINADMIAMATHGRTGFAHLLAGSIAEDVVSHGKRPVLTFVTKRKR
jgi:nucleotide-binding universal stress UspA family protein